MRVCPACGEPLRHDWVRPVLIGAAIILGVAAVLIVGPRLMRGLDTFQPSVAVSTVQAVASEVPVLVAVPTLTPSPTPSRTPTPTNTPTPTTMPSSTPMPTLTPAPTETPTPTPTETVTPTATRVRPSATPTESPPTPTPAPTVPPPTLEKPESGTPYGGANAKIQLLWRGSHTLDSNEFYEVTLRYIHLGAEVPLKVRVQGVSWMVDEMLYGQADQETQGVYHWSVRLVRRATDAEGNEGYVPISPASEEWLFYWR